MNISQEDRELIRKFIEVKNRGYYVDGGQLTTVYNRVLNKSERPTNCGTCLRQRVQALEDALKRTEEIEKRALELQKKEEVINTPTEENKVSGEPKKKVGRPSKKS